MSPYLFFCDHATNFIPSELENLGLPAAELERHIAYDIGAAGVTKVLSEIFAAPAIFSTVSRLVIDCNRHLTAMDSIPEISDGTIIPGNLKLSDSSRESRIATYFAPYHQAIETALDARQGHETIAISIHSMTPNLAGTPRPWQIALSSHHDRRFTDPVLAALRRQTDITVGDNQPYDLDPAFDYSTPAHASSRGLLHLQVEFRQDEISTAEAQRSWAQRLARALTAVESR